MAGKDRHVMNALNYPVANTAVANETAKKFPIPAIVKMVGWDTFVINLFVPKAVIWATLTVPNLENANATPNTVEKLAINAKLTGIAPIQILRPIAM